MKLIFKTLFVFAALCALTLNSADACSNLLITKGASKDGSVMVTYSADAHVLYGELYHTPAGVFPKGSILKVYEWDTGRYMGDIAQIERTYSTMGNMNEHQLIITETTFGGREELVDTTGIIDYGSLIYITLQRAKTAREAIKIMSDLVNTYGYASSGESFSIADKNEVWIMELIGKGTKLNKKGINVNKGAVWVAIRIPDGYISAHANQSRITTFPLNDPENCLYSPDVIDFAQEMGYYKGKDENFSFCDAFAPADFGALRGCEARVWSAFNILGKGMIGEKPAADYLDFAMGHNPANKMPLYIKPYDKLSLKEVADVMRDHYEDTPMDMRKDIGAGGFELPYRWRPMDFKVGDREFTNERAIATQQTGFWLLGQSRNWLPDEIGGIIWFGVDDAATSCLTPVYSAGVRVPECFAHGNGNMTTYSPTSAFWLFNRVAHAAYLRYNLLAPEVRAAADEHENGALQIIPTVNKEALRILNEKSGNVKEYLTKWSEMFADRMFKKWKELDEYLLVKYIDGNVKRQNPDGSFMDNGFGAGIPANPEQPGYSQKWMEAVAADHAAAQTEIPKPKSEQTEPEGVSADVVDPAVAVSNQTGSGSASAAATTATGVNTSATANPSNANATGSVVTTSGTAIPTVGASAVTVPTDSLKKAQTEKQDEAITKSPDQIEHEQE